MDESSGKGSLTPLSNYRLGKTLGIGAFGKVKAAQHILTGVKVAIKILARQSFHDYAAEKVRREINIMRLLSHPHIVRLYEVIETRSAIYVIMEYMNSGELFDYITENSRLEEDEARHFFQQIISGVESCHLHMVVHRDLKPENLLIDSKGNVKIADFGLANVMRDGHLLKTSCGSPNYASPEVISGSLYAGPEVDVWSCGVVLYALLCGSLPFDDESLSGLYAKIKSGIYTYPNYLSIGARDLITRMLLVDPVNRISIPEIYKHAWFQKHLPQYIAGCSINASWSARKVDVQVLEEMGIIGFDVQEVIGSLNNLLHNQATVTYSILLHKHLSNHSYHNDYLLGSLPPECMERRDIYVRPISPVQGKWVLGFKSRASPHETMGDVLTVFKSLNVQWKKIGPYNMKCIWKPAVESYSMPMAIHRISLTEDTDVPMKSSNKGSFSSYDAVKFEIQLYRATTAESYLLDWQRIYGPPFLFIELCAGFRACVVIT
ncbi:SNF1-related protein kinase catalytic subunit alpha KIN10-like isoform X1 [Cynara cardunculus var. scolymus]|uniref:SNF1-related protein kinase catalytic subunit alpha KIN10-like isoform X1 n=1 Tax=Cynara cardunculus var. scolymus TaxID=59895 RepID=UPI000D62C9A5|nr:SNF1-related protein kinase catalytic subunit alpha KIN10-like isoform X1 [Cynara cardunculus var. scolymus]XP_024980724.1 SNF1-related protein kinase catalytic subunit alpha KIN10-like isoform X1 [Cynara cardunculus var. scolymus]